MHNLSGQLESGLHADFVRHSSSQGYTTSVTRFTTGSPLVQNHCFHIGNSARITDMKTMVRIQKICTIQAKPQTRGIRPRMTTAVHAFSRPREQSFESRSRVLGSAEMPLLARATCGHGEVTTSADFRFGSVRSGSGRRIK